MSISQLSRPHFCLTWKFSSILKSNKRRKGEIYEVEEVYQERIELKRG